MLAVLLMLAGVAFMVGAKDFAGKIAKGVLGIVLILTAIPCLVQSCACFLPGTGAAKSPSPPTVSRFLLMMVALVAVGLVAWRRRAERARARELWVRRNGAPRNRALPAPPSNGQTNDNLPTP
jgi:hypothetical protein